MRREQVLNHLRAQKVVALIRADSADCLLDCCRALQAGGLSAIELTMTTPDAIALVGRVSRELPDILIGLGTVLKPETARAGIAAGAKFIVTPAVRPNVIDACRHEGVAVLSGALTPTEACNAWDVGADVVKIFPAEYFGPAYIKSLKAPFPAMEFMPTGGVTPESVGLFLRAGAFATAAGSALVDPAKLAARDWAGITARAKQFVSAANQH